MAARSTRNGPRRNASALSSIFPLPESPMTDQSSRPVVYIVDDDADLGASLARLLIRSGFAAEPFLDPAQLLAAYAAAPADCIVTDVMMGEMDGFAFADRL